ncbi:CapA family protein [Granulosicoccus sp.]|nr:CapA family protein [Granulosicoccus sp.]MDB4222427.1 CapA family protein [Granulosicoccus sp.]
MYDKQNNEISVRVAQTVPEKEESSVTLFFGGDFVVQNIPKRPSFDASIKRFIRSADFSICNFEAPVRTDATRAPKSGSHIDQEKWALEFIAETGFSAVALANNHIMDYGHQGLVATLAEADRVGLSSVGAGIDREKATKSLRVYLHGKDIAIFNACEWHNGVIGDEATNDSAGYSWLNSTTLDVAVMNARAEGQLVIVFAHAGLEHYPLPQSFWRSRYKRLVEAGADIVIGSHPHVVQGYERVGSSIIFYSLGNMFFYNNKYAERADPGFSLYISCFDNNKISVTIVTHHKEGECLLPGPLSEADIADLNELLDSGYARNESEMNASVGENLGRLLRYSQSPVSFDGNVLSSAKRLIQTKILGMHFPPKNILFAHLLSNESYRHALLVKHQNKSG